MTWTMKSNSSLHFGSSRKDLEVTPQGILTSTFFLFGQILPHRKACSDSKGVKFSIHLWSPVAIMRCYLPCRVTSTVQASRNTYGGPIRKAGPYHFSSFFSLYRLFATVQQRTCWLYIRGRWGHFNFCQVGRMVASISLRRTGRATAVELWKHLKY